MLEVVQEVIGLNATIGDRVVGKVRDLLVDEPSWSVRFLVVQNKLGHRHKHTTVPSEFVDLPDVEGGRLPIRLADEQFESMSDSETVLPLSDEEEAAVKEVFGGVDHRLGGGPMATMHGVVPPRVLAWARSKRGKDSSTGQRRSDGPILHSLQRMSGYSVETEDGERYPVRGVLADPNSWVVRYLVVDTKDWKPGAEVLLPMAWVQQVSWSESGIFVKGRTSTLRGCQRFSPRSHQHSPSR